MHDSTQESSEGLIDNLGHWLVGINFAIRILNFCSLLDRDSYFSEYFIEERALINQRFKDILGLDENILSKEHLYEKLLKQNDYPIKGKKADHIDVPQKTEKISSILWDYFLQKL